MAIKFDKLESAFRELREELNKATCPHTGKDAKLCPEDCPCKKDMKKNVNMSYAPAPNSPAMGTSGGQGGMYRSEDMDKNVVPPMTMQLSEEVEKQMASASPGGAIDQMAMSEKLSIAKNGQWSLDKQEGANEEANPTQPHNKGKFKVMPMTSEKDSKKEDVKGKPYNGEDKKIHKGEHQGNNARGFDENKAPGRGTLSN